MLIHQKALTSQGNKQVASKFSTPSNGEPKDLPPDSLIRFFSWCSNYAGANMTRTSHLTWNMGQPWSGQCIRSEIKRCGPFFEK